MQISPLRFFRHARAEIVYRISISRMRLRTRWHNFIFKTERRAKPYAVRLAQWIANHFGARAAAAAMFELNHATRDMLKRSSTRETIYAAKNLLVRTLYERGYCVRAVQQKQELKCWECNGTGGWDNSDMGNECWEPCYKCDATGVYAEHTLYKFTFRIGKRHYSWHQPTRLVTWDVALTSTDVGTFEDKPRKRMRIIRDQLVLAFLYHIVVEYLTMENTLSAPEAQP